MRFVERQARLEQRTYQAIDELEEVFGVEISRYPEVRWFGRLGHFEDLGLSECYREKIEGLQKYGLSAFVSRENVIVLNGDDSAHINEESAHCVHLSTSNICGKRRPMDEWLLANSIVEMFGFLGSLFLDPSRKNVFHDRVDCFQTAYDKKISFRDTVHRLNALPEKFENEFIYTQGYGLGERTFDALQTGQVNMDYVRRLFKLNFSEPGQVITVFEKLRAKVWPMK